MIEYMSVGIVSLAIGVYAGFKLGYAYTMRVSQGLDLTGWIKSLLPFGNM